MTVAAWPSDLPTFNAGLRVRSRAGFVRTPNGIGPPLQRRRYSSTATDYTGQMVFNQAQMTAYEAFYHTTLAEGSKEFTMFDPVTGNQATFRFREPTEFILQGGDASGHATVFIGTLQLERLP